MVRAVVIFSISLLIVAFVIAAVVTVVVLLIKGLVKKFAGRSKRQALATGETIRIPREKLRFPTPSICDAFPIAWETNGAEESEDLPEFYVWEDDWRQVEFMPTSLRTELLAEVAEVAKFKVDKWEGGGWTDVYVRRERADGLPSVKLPFSELRKLFGFWRCHDLSVVRWSPDREQGVTVRKVLGAFAFESSREAYFYGQEHAGSVVVLALNIFGEGRGDLAGLTDKLLEIGEKFPLLMVDWNSDVVVDLCEPKEVRRWVGAFSSVVERGSTPTGL